MRPLSIMDAFRIMGPAFLVSVALVDPGNWATSIEAGSKFGYELVWVVVASNLIAILLQTLAARLGIVTGKHLAQVCRESYPPQVCALLWVLCEISIVALDLTMLLGTAIGLNLLLGWPLLPCIVLTSLDALLLLLLVPAQGVKKSEALTVGLLAVVVACFLVDLLVSRPPLASVVSGLLPRLRRDSVYTAVSLLGANVMPHNFYLHSALVSGQAAKAAAAGAGLGGERDGERGGRRGVIRALCLYNFLDIFAALGVALVINVAVLLVSAATFHSAGVVVHTLQAAHDLMEQTLSSSIAPAAFGTALLCAGQLSTFTGTIAGQVVLQGFLNIHISTWLRRLITRTAAIIPAAVLQYVYGDRGTYKFLLIAQVVLALQLPVTLVPLIKATSSRQLMGPHASSRLLAAAAWGATGLIFLANLMLFVTQMLPEVSSGRGILDKDGPLDAWLDRVASLAYSDPLRAVGLVGLLVAASAFLALQLWMIITPLRVDAAAASASALAAAEPAVAAAAAAKPTPRSGSGGGMAEPPEGGGGGRGGGGGPSVACAGPSDAAVDGRAGKGWFDLWGSGSGAARGGQRGRRLGAAQAYGHASGGGGGAYGAAVALPSEQSQQQQQQQQWTRTTSWNWVGEVEPDPFVTAAASASAGGFGRVGWVIPRSAISRVLSSGPLPYDVRAAAAGAALLPLPWRPRERYRRRRSGCFCSEGETGSDDGGGSSNDSSDSDSDSEGVLGGVGAGLDRTARSAPALARRWDGTTTITTAAAAIDISSSGAAAANISASSNSSSTTAAGPATDSEALWARQLSLPPAGEATGLVAGEGVAAVEAAGISAAATTAAVAAQNEAVGSLGAVATVAAAAAIIEPAAAAAPPLLIGATVWDADVATSPPTVSPETAAAAAAVAAAAAEAAAGAGSGGQRAAAARPKHPVSRGTRPKVAKLLEDFWASFYDAHGRSVCAGAREAPPRGGRPHGSSAGLSRGPPEAQAELPPPPPPQQQERQASMQQPAGEWLRLGHSLAASVARGGGGSDGGGGSGARGRVGLRSMGSGGGGEEDYRAGGAATAAEPASRALAPTAATAAAASPSSPLICTHTECSHLCMGCSQALFEAVRQCLWALEQLEGVEAAVWGVWPLQLVLPPDNQTFHYHRAVLLATRNADFPALQALCAGTYASRVDQSRLLASTPLTQSGAAALPPPPPLPSAAAAPPAAPAAVAVARELSSGGVAAAAAGGGAAARQPELGCVIVHTCSHERLQLQHQQQQQPPSPLQFGSWWARDGSNDREAAAGSTSVSQTRLQPQQGGGGGGGHRHPLGPAGPRPAGAKGAACLMPHGPADAAPAANDLIPEASRPAPSALAPSATACMASPLPLPPLPPASQTGLGSPTVSSWCLFGPAAFVSFGVWSVFTLAQWCAADSRPAHWGQYASVLNRLQGALRDARLDLTAPAAPVEDGTAVAAGGATAAPPPLALPAGPMEEPAPHTGQQPLNPQPPHQPPPPSQAQHQHQRNRQRAYGRGGVNAQHSRQLRQQPLQQQQTQQQAHQQQQQELAALPVTALRLCPQHLALLRWELLQQMEGMEASVLERRGPADTRAGQVAFPKAKEIMASVMRRYRRRLGAPAAAAATAGGGGGGGGAPAPPGEGVKACGSGAGEEGSLRQGWPRSGSGTGSSGRQL
ncbi:hypothetical protein PLESTB_000375800 [Pleodorina starrii]|uniref:Uncharacterized protein n=1 Tax=Pleodorina starrii TaxID=330485 RepID=A0A9W6BF67_9CHLO|nr:hypothetical protein PLESTM_000019000 [Pleodorina starrii]GLC50406.1 hypothetical protein PLESTB_000375800 [Pleodorina starrii]GLC64213.1 hypothetical protein PLESTF_000136900 [Pleodorina starrii]